MAKRVQASASLESWPKLSAPAVVPNAAVRTPEFHHGEKDCAATLATGWNEKGLFFEVVVKDDEFVQKWKGWHTWKGDALQFGFAKNARLKAGANAMADQMDMARSEISLLAPLPPGVTWTRPKDEPRQAYTSCVHAAVAGVGRLTETGELLVSTQYPEMTLHLFGKDGKEVTDGGWPRGGTERCAA